MTVLFLAGGGAGVLGALLGLGGGVFLVPFLVLVLHLPMRLAVGISLTTVIATSSVVTSGRLGRSLVNLRLGMLLEVATTAGGLAGGITAASLSTPTLERLFGIVAMLSAVAMLTRLERRNVILDPAADPGRLGGRYYEAESGAVVSYQVRRVPLAMVVSFVAGSVSSLLGLGGGILKVPALNIWCGVPMRAAAATSAFMIGVTATAGAVIYYGRGEVVAWMAAATVLGVMVGSRAGFAVGARARAKWLKILLAAVLVAVSMLMLVKS
ncbi:MAG TPA: sulfite exporter TauE/SafE family protein [Vicinamibacterales bacterium]